VPSARDLLERFRPAGTPGAATAAGVPADRREAVAAELQPVFAALAETERECDEIGHAATAAAEERAAGTTRRVHAILDRARAEAPAERAAAAALRRDHEATDLDRIVAAGRAAVATETRRAGERLPQLVTAVVAAVRTDLGRLDGDSR